MTTAHKVQVAVLVFADIVLPAFLIWDVRRWLRKRRNARVTNSDVSTEQ